MKKQLSIAVGCLLLMAGLAFGQTTQSIDLYTSGSTTQTSGSATVGGTFNLDTYVTFSGFTGQGLSYWLEVPNALAPHITITGESYMTWTDPNGSFFVSDPFNDTTGADANFMGESRDLGGTSIISGGNPVQAQPAGTYKVSTLNFALDGTTPTGTYSINTEVISPRQSEINDTQNPSVAHLVAQKTYTLTVNAVPEPATWSLMGLGGLGAFGLNWLRARRRS